MVSLQQNQMYNYSIRSYDEKIILRSEEINFEGTPREFLEKIKENN